MTRGRWTLPGPPLLGRALGAAGLGTLGALALGACLSASIDDLSIRPGAAAAGFAAMMSVAIAAMNGHHPFARLGPAVHVTMLRGMLLALVASGLAAPLAAVDAWLAVGASVLFAVLDGFDGWLARRTRMDSAFGARFDMELDALFILVLSVLVWQHGKSGVWVLGAGLMRYAFVAAGWFLPWLARPLRPTRRGRLVAVLALAILTAALAPATPVAISRPAVTIAVAALAVSFTIDVRFLWRKRRQGQKRTLDGDRVSGAP